MSARFDHTLDEARHVGSTAGERARREAEASERMLIEQARAEAAALLSEVRARVVSESDAARQRLRDEAPLIAQMAAALILGRPVA